MNTPRTAEVVILLDMINTISKKSYDINGVDITVVSDNKAIWRMVYRSLVIPNYFNQDAGAKVSLVKRLIEQCNIHLILQKLKATRKSPLHLSKILGYI